MRFGIFSNGQRHWKDVGASWDEDLHEILVADRLGLEEAWVSEHTGGDYLPDALPSPEMLIIKAAALTERIRFGSAVRRIALYPPVQTAMEAVVCQHLTGGRYTFGYGTGGPASGFEQRGLDLSEVSARTAEAIDLIERCWGEPEPFDYSGDFYQGRNINVYPKPMEASGVPAAIASTRREAIQRAARRGHRLLTSQFGRPASHRRIAEFYLSATPHARRADILGVRGCYLAETDERAVAEVADTWRAHLEYNKTFFGPAFREYVRDGQTTNDLTFEQLMDDGLIFIGSPSTVAARIREFHDQSGGFGTFLMVAGKTWGTREQREASYHRFAEQVRPKLADLGALEAAKAHAA